MRLSFLLRTLTRSLALLLTIAVVATISASAQQWSLKYPYERDALRAIPGRVVVKLTADAHARGVDARTLALEHSELGIYQSAAFVRPALVAYRPNQKDAPIGAHAASELERIVVVSYAALASPHEVAATIMRTGLVEYAEPMYPRRLHYSTNDPGASQQWYLDVIGVTTAWDVVRADTSLVIAVVDAGFDVSHEDLSGAVWYNHGEMGADGGGADRRTNGVDDDGNGYVDDWKGYDFAGADGRTPDNDPDPRSESHGTEMAGIAGAIGDNSKGTVGVAFGARLMNLKITDEPSSPFASPDLFNGHEAILYAAKMGADVINCSWGDLGRMRSEQEVISVASTQYGAVVVASAGNSSNDNVFYPSGYDGVLSVGAVEAGDSKASFSNFNYRIDVSAPGAFIYGPVLSNRYAHGSGTSHAAAVTSGAVALLRQRFPALRSSQLIELMRATTDDNSGHLGQYAGRLGTGRINVGTAMSIGATVSSARLARYVVVDASGDGILDPGESVNIVVDVHNHLAAAASVMTALASVSPAITIDNAQADLGAMDAGATASTPPTAFRFTVPSQSAPNSSIVLKFSAQTPSRTNDSYIVLTVAPTFMTTDLNRIAATFNSEGNIGYNGTNRRQGDGVRSNGGKDLLYHGGLMIGTSASRLSDVVRVGPLSAGTARGLQMTSPYRIATSQDNSVEIGRAVFDDAHRDEASRVGVAVTMRTFEYADPLDRDYVLIVYDVRNTSPAALENLQIGQYLDFDIALAGDGDVVGLDESHRLGHVSNAQSPGIVAGAAVLGDIGLSFNAVDNNQLDVGSSFPPETKWQLLGNGIGSRSTNPTDAGIVIGAGPFVLQPGESRAVGFVLTAATTIDELRSAVTRASQRFEILSSTGAPIESKALSADIRPNPSFGRAVIDLSLDRASDVSIRIVDASGRIVLPMAIRQRYDAGSHHVDVDLSSLSSGVYFCDIIAGGSTRRLRVVKLTQ